MMAARWLLGGTLVLFGGGFVVLSLIAGGFRRSFGTSELKPQTTILPLVAVGLLRAALIIPGNSAYSTRAPAQRFCFWQIIDESAATCCLGIVYWAAWMGFYGVSSAAGKVTARPPRDR